jgi:hypothetical protein
MEGSAVGVIQHAATRMLKQQLGALQASRQAE